MEYFGEKETDAFRILHGWRSSLRDVVGQVDEELSQAALGGCVVAEDRRERGIPKRLGETLPQSLSGPAVVAQTMSALEGVGREE